MMSDKFDKIDQEDLEKVTGGMGNTDLRMINDAGSEQPGDDGSNDVVFVDRPTQINYGAPRR